MRCWRTGRASPLSGIGRSFVFQAIVRTAGGAATSDVLYVGL
jgi:hypothetical protein